MRVKRADSPTANSDGDTHNRNLIDGSYSIEDLVDIDRLREILEQFSAATGFTATFCASPSMETLIRTGWRDLCTQFHRTNPVSRQECSITNQTLRRQMVGMESCGTCDCGHGLTHGGVPIVIRGIRVASLWTGQVLLEKPDIEAYRERARTYGYDEDAYLAALRDVPVVPEQVFRKTLSFLSGMATMIAELGLSTLRKKESADLLRQQIADRERAEQSGAESRSTLEGVLSSMADFVFAIDTDGVFIFHHSPDEALLSVLPERFMGRSYADVLPSHLSEAVADVIEKNKAGDSVEFEYNLEIEGKARWFSAKVSPSFQNGAYAGSVAVVRDVTGRRTAERILRESESKYRSLVETFSDIVFITDYSGNTLYANPSLKHQTGYTADELQFGPEENLFIHPDDVGRVTEFVREFTESDRRYSQVIENRVIDKNGQTHWYSSVISKTEFLAKPALQCIARNISDERRAEEALRLSQDRFYKAFHVSPNAVVITSLVDQRLMEINEIFSKMYGYTRAEALGKTSVELGIWGDLAQRDEVFDAVKRGAHIREWEVASRTKDGSRGVCDLWIERIDLDGEPCMLTVVRDITERKEAEAEREKAFKEIERLKVELERERDYLREEVNVAFRFGEIIGESPALQHVLAKIGAVAPTNANVLILGESGVGKELFARAIHSRSPRQDEALVKVNCASIPRELFESEFFGHVKGAFTGAHRDRVGRFQLADGGTLFLDEVAEIPPELQSKLLRVIQEGEFERVGEERTSKVSVRVIAATNRDLSDDVRKGHFREDLFYRLGVFPIEVPALRERREDIISLATHFLERACRDFDRSGLAFSRAQAEALHNYDWPGNIRELQNVIERAVILSKGTRLWLELAQLPATRRGDTTTRPAHDPGTEPVFVTDEEIQLKERENMVAALESAGWRVSGPDGAAELLGLKPSTLSYRMKTMGIQKPGAD